MPMLPPVPRLRPTRPPFLPRAGNRTARAGHGAAHARHGTAHAPWAWAWVGALLGGLLAAVPFAPARWLAAAVDQVTQGRLLLSAPQGTLWRGSAQLAVTGGAGSHDQSALPGRWHWQLQPQWHVGAPGVRGTLQSDCCVATPWAWSLNRTAGAWQLSLADHQARLPSDWLAGLGTPLNTVQPEARLALQTQAMVVRQRPGGWQLQGQVTLQAHDVASRLSTVRPMGSYQAVLHGGEVPRLSLTTLQGPLLLSGEGQFLSGRLRFAGEASAEPDRADALANLLNILGRRQGARSLITLG
jgi:general secretion pathway protein N